MIYKRIEDSLKDAIAYHNEGISANDSMVKSAEKHELNPETICRVVEAFNIAKTRAYIKNASVKDGDFDTADKAVVIQRVFGDNVKKAASAVPLDKEPEYKFSIKKHDEMIQKKAERFSDFDVNENIIKSKYAFVELKNEIEICRLDVFAAKELFNYGLQKAADFFSYTHNAEDSDELFNSALYQYDKNQTASDVVDLISKVAGLEYEEPNNIKPCEYGYSPFHEILDGMIDDADDYSQKVAEYNALVEKANKETIELDDLIAKVVGIEKSATDYFFASKLKAQKDRFEKFATSVIEEAHSLLFETKVAQVEEPKVSATSFIKRAAPVGVPLSVGGIDIGNIPLFGQLETDGSKKLQEYAEKGNLARLQERGSDSLEKDQIDAEMQGLKRHAIVQDLMANDEIISGYDPKISLSAYNTMMKLAPKASLMPDVVRSVLRYATAQTIDPHYASQLVELENNIAKREAGVVSTSKK